MFRPLYAGKARCIRRRLAQHFASGNTTPELRALRDQVALYFSAISTPTEAQASWLEAELILRLRPPFNRQVPRIYSIREKGRDK